MSSELKTNKISPATGTAFTLGDSGVTFTVPSGVTLTNNGSASGFGKVLQVVSGTNNSEASNNTTTYADTGLSLAITPSATSSKVLVIVQQNGTGPDEGNSGNAISLKLMRDSTDLQEFALRMGYTNTALRMYIGTNGTVHLDSPSTTSAVTYKTQFKNRVAANNVYCQINGSVSSIVLMEIEG